MRKTLVDGRARMRNVVGLVLFGTVGLSATDAAAQSTAHPQPIPGIAARRLPNPMRRTTHSEPIAAADPASAPILGDPGWEVTGHGSDSIVPPDGLLWEPKHPHQILRAPLANPASPTTGDKHAWATKHWVHPPYSSHRRRVQPTPPVLPGANQRETWKTPYSYGYFGASGTRHWSLHHGYRDRYTEWRLK